MYKMVWRNLIIFCQDNDKKYCIAFATENFFEEGLAQNKKSIGLFYIHKWYKRQTNIVLLLDNSQKSQVVKS